MKSLFGDRIEAQNQFEIDLNRQLFWICHQYWSELDLEKQEPRQLVNKQIREFQKSLARTIQDFESLPCRARVCMEGVRLLGSTQSDNIASALCLLKKLKDKADIYLEDTYVKSPDIGIALTCERLLTLIERATGRQIKAQPRFVDVEAANEFVDPDAQVLLKLIQAVDPNLTAWQVRYAIQKAKARAPKKGDRVADPDPITFLD